MNLVRRVPFFETPRCLAVALCAEDAPALQDFLDANPKYSEIVNGRPFRPGEALEEITDAPPFTYNAMHALAVLDRASGKWLGFVSLVDDLIAPGVCHIGLLIVATDCHGLGLGTEIYEALERRAKSRGDRWMRLGVVVGNGPAEALWRSVGFREVRQRHNMPYEGASRSVRVMFKPLCDEGLDRYLEQVHRDRPESP
jgi:ribosomal protein S18 acetylase RimI-like enzyme